MAQPRHVTILFRYGVGRAFTLRNPGVTRCRVLVERVTRIELALSAWEADVLPLNYTRLTSDFAGRSGSTCLICASEAVRTAG